MENKKRNADSVHQTKNICNPEARKIVESRSPTLGISYAAVAAQKFNNKSYRTIETRTDFPANNNTDLLKLKENVNKIPIKLSDSTETSLLQQTKTKKKSKTGEFCCLISPSDRFIR